MFKKFRKYLIVLMAVVMVASLAVIPTAALTGDVVEGVYQSGGYWYKHVHTYAIESTQSNRFHTWARVDFPSGGGVCDYDPDNFEIGIRMGMSDAYGDLCANSALADSFYGYGDYGFDWI
ncbi:MAG TPA: hypothetical protein PK629_05040 [Oscillospiraceae bacterium]|nr:hypothetical protein [Oscillospiraceae bacterium]